MHDHPPRADQQTAQLIREALAMGRAFDLRTAATFLRMRNVPVDLAARVLAAPHRQRRQF